MNTKMGVRLIDADAFEEKLKKFIGGTAIGFVLVGALRNEPTVDAVEVVHGRWNDGECTACGFDIRDLIDADSDFRNWVWDGLPYCPDCGAKMDGGKL